MSADLSSCPYYRGVGTCESGCTTEPACVTCEPRGGWPSGVKQWTGTDAERAQREFDANAWNRAIEHSNDGGDGRPHTLEPVEEDDGTWAGHMVCIDDGTPCVDPYELDARGCGFTTRAAS